MARASVGATVAGRVSGDFDVVVRVTYMTADLYSDRGIIVRVPDPTDAGSGENYLLMRYVVAFNENNVRGVDDAAATNYAVPGPMLPWLRVTRLGGSFRFFTRATPARRRVVVESSRGPAGRGR